MKGKEKLNNVVIGIEEVDYLITTDSALQITKEQDLITLHRLIDNKDILFPLEQVKKALKNKIIDRL